ncbi:MULTISPECIES: hypothetical protein [Pelosinus]|nr:MULTISPECIES: hypothetical protein [Pelosinus]
MRDFKNISYDECGALIDCAQSVKYWNDAKLDNWLTHIVINTNP